MSSEAKDIDENSFMSGGAKKEFLSYCYIIFMCVIIAKDFLDY